MRPKMGKVLPEMGKVLHPGPGEGASDVYAKAIAGALRQELGATRQGIKTAMRWTGASERTVKYWFAGATGPSGEHLIALARHSDVILAVFLRQADRLDYARALRLIDARESLKELLQTIQMAVGDSAIR